MATNKSKKVNFTEFLKNVFFPKFCFGCGRVGTYLCPECTSKLQIIDRDICAICEKASYFGLTHNNCKKRYSIESFFVYEGLAKKIITKIKYQLVSESIDDLVATINIESFKKITDFCNLFPGVILIPVPLHEKRKAMRGFNQSEYIFSIIAQKLGIEIKNNLVMRTKHTDPQAHMKSPRARMENVKGAFEISENVKDRSFIICDDVWTTGSTIKEITLLLKQNGAKKVCALTIARVYV